MIGKNHQGALMTLVERKSMSTVMRAGLRKTTAAVRSAATEALTPLRDRVHTITYDNGREFADHEGMADALETQIYFAHPYALWELGFNENTHLLIRQYLPKNQELTNVTDKESERAMDKLNDHPRKTLGFRTPHKVFFNTKTSLTVALSC